MKSELRQILARFRPFRKTGAAVPTPGSIPPTGRRSGGLIWPFSLAF
jgi:hypothetical protein